MINTVQVALLPGSPQALKAQEPLQADPGTLQAWLRELEQARWDARSAQGRDSDQGHASGATGPDASDPRRTADSPAASHPAESDAHRLQRQAAAAPSLFMAGAVATSAMRQGQASTDQAQPPPTPSAWSAPPTMVGRAGRAAGERGHQAASPSETQRPEPADQWQPSAMHVESSDDGVTVWLRDARLTAQDALRLNERLRRVFPGTVRLSVNGQPVVPDAAPALNNHSEE